MMATFLAPAAVCGYCDAPLVVDTLHGAHVINSCRQPSCKGKPMRVRDVPLMVAPPVPVKKAKAS